jgi:hypothetical protein
MDQAASKYNQKNLKPFLIQTKPKSQKSLFSQQTSHNDSFSDDGKKMGKWLKDEDELLLNAVTLYGTKNWRTVSNFVPGRNQVQCLHRWTKILQPGLTKGPWSIEEDRKLLQWVKKEGACKWTTCAEFIKGRSGKQCRERWLNTLNPNVKKGGWEPEEDFLIFKLFSQFGSQWSKICVYFERRTENSIKNRFYSTLRRIAAEKKRDDDGTEEGKKTTKSKLDSLLKFIPDAMNEKTEKIMSKSNGRNFFKNENLIIVDYENKNQVLNVEEEFEKNLNFDTKNQINQRRFEEKIDELRSTEPSQNNIFYEENVQNYDENMGLLDNEISHFLDSFFETSTNEKNCNLSFIHCDDKIESEETSSNLNVNNDNINEMVNQLSSLEEMLQNTKRQILSDPNGL